MVAKELYNLQETWLVRHCMLKFLLLHVCFCHLSSFFCNRKLPNGSRRITVDSNFSTIYQCYQVILITRIKFNMTLSFDFWPSHILMYHRSRKLDDDFELLTVSINSFKDNNTLWKSSNLFDPLKRMFIR